MHRFIETFFLVGLTTILVACAPTLGPTEPQTIAETEFLNSQATDQFEATATDQVTLISTPTEAVLSTDAIEITNEYDKCGTGMLVEVPYYFKDDNSQFSPTQLMRKLTTDDGVRDYVSLSTCLEYDEGWISDADEVEKGYENKVLFFDKYGRAHSYRIIIGGHYIAPYDSTHKDITASINGVDDKYYHVDEWIDITREQYQSSGVRQIGLELYISDNQGNLSKVLSQVYQFRETNLQIQKALETGEGYPEVVPDGFFLFATKAWLINPE